MQTEIAGLNSGNSASRYLSRLNESVLYMVSSIPRPKQNRWRFDDLARGKKVNVLGTYSEMAALCLRSGAPLAHVLAPMREAEAWLRSQVESCPSLRDVLINETKKQGAEDVPEVVLAEHVDNPSDSQLDAFIKAAEEHREALTQAIDCARRMRYGK